MNRTRRAITAAGFQYTHLTLALASGVVLFPMTLRAIGVDDFGLWLVSGEIVGYLLLGDLGVFATLPWLIAARAGAEDRPGIAQLTADGLAVGAVVALGLAAAAAALWTLDPSVFGIDAIKWAAVREPLVVMLGLSALASPLRAALAILAGLQDVVFCGWIGIVQLTLTVALTVWLVLRDGYGLMGLAIIAVLPQVLGGAAAMVRVFVAHRYALALPRPTPAGVGRLVREGSGQWVSGFGVRLLTGSASLILAGLGRSGEATLYAATGKVPQILQTVGWILPDSGLIGLGQVRTAGNPEQTRRAVLSLLMMYLLTSGVTAFAVLTVNPALTRWWLGSDLYAGDAVNGVVALNLIFAAAVTGLFKVVTTAAYRPTVGLATLVFGGLAVALSFELGRLGGLAWMAAGPSVAAALFAIPVGLRLVPKVYPLTAREVVRWWLDWMIRSTPFLAVGAAVGVVAADHPAWCFGASLMLGFGYLAFLRPVIGAVPWPATARRILTRLKLVPVSPNTRSS